MPTWTVTLAIGSVEADTQEEALRKASALAPASGRLVVTRQGPERGGVSTNAPPSGGDEAMVPLANIARELGVSVSALRDLVDGLYRAGEVDRRYVKTNQGALYPVEAVKRAIAPHVPALLQRQRRAEENQAAERAAAEARRAERARAHAAHVARKAARMAKRGSSGVRTAPATLPTRRSSKTPEVFVAKKPIK